MRTKSYKHIWLLLINGFIFILFLLFAYLPSNAQTSTQATASPILPTSTPLLTSTLNLNPSSSATPSPQLQTVLARESGALTLTLAELGYDEDIIIVGPLGQAEFELNLPSYWEILPGSSLTLHHLPEKGLYDSIGPFELQVLFDEVIIHRAVLNTFEEQSLNIPLPEIQAGYREDHTLKIVLRSHGACEEGGLLKIFSDSFFTLNHQITPPLLDLAYYPSPIYEPTFFTQTAYLLLPDQPTALEVEGALSLGARLGQLTENKLLLTTATASTLAPANLPDEHLIIVGTPENNPLLSYLNDTSSLPASFQRRRLQLASRGPDLIVSGSPLTYTLYITNSETISASKLGVDVQLPPGMQSVGCQSECQSKNNTIHWDIRTLPPGATSALTLSLVYPLTATLEPVNLSFELTQNQKAINVTTLNSLVAAEGKPRIIQTASSSPFFFVLEGQAVPEADGIVQFLPSPQGFDKAILLVTGLTDEAVYKASRALGIQPELLSMKGQVMLIQNIIEADSSNSELPESLTLADLGYEDRLILGTASQDASYRLEFPLNWSLSPEAEVRLNFSHSLLVDPARSSITLLFNNAPLASSAVDESNAVIGELKALIPPERVRPGRPNNLTVRVELESINPCIDPDSGQLWLNLKNSSSLYLPHTPNQAEVQFDLNFLPAPFMTNSNLSDVRFALPENPSNVEYDAALKIVSYLGSVSEDNNFQPFVLLGDPNNIDLSTSHLIIIGRPTRNGILQELNELLPQPFIPGTDAIKPQVDKIVFRLPDNLDLGYLELIPSSWSQNHAFLAVTGTSDLGLTWATQMVTEPKKNEQLKGNLALAPDNLEVHTVDTRELPIGGEIAAVTSAIPETVVVGTATPTPLPPVSTPIAQSESSHSLAVGPPSTILLSPPAWFPYVIGGGIALIFIILGVAYWQSRRRLQVGAQGGR